MLFTKKLSTNLFVLIKLSGINSGQFFITLIEGEVSCEKCIKWHSGHWL